MAANDGKNSSALWQSHFNFFKITRSFMTNHLPSHYVRKAFNNGTGFVVCIDMTCGVHKHILYVEWLHFILHTLMTSKSYRGILCILQQPRRILATQLFSIQKGFSKIIIIYIFWNDFLSIRNQLIAGINIASCCVVLLLFIFRQLGFSDFTNFLLAKYGSKFRKSHGQLLLYFLFRGQVFHYYVLLSGFDHIQTLSTLELLFCTLLSLLWEWFYSSLHADFHVISGHPLFYSFSFQWQRKPKSRN